MPDPLTPLHRLALSYAPASMRESTYSLMLLDERLAAILRLGGEPMIAQIKLAWWRDRLTEEQSSWPAGEPLLARLRDWPGEVSDLARVVDGWETLLSERFGPEELDAYAAGRGGGWTALAETCGADEAAVDRAARQWAIADLLPHLAKPEEAELARACLDQAAPRIPRPLRPLAVLRKLTVKAALQGHGDPLHGAGALFAALRAGLTGR